MNQNRMGKWRLKAWPIIKKVLEDTKGEPEKVIRKALVVAYPFGERGGWPYKVWLDEIKRQRGLPRIARAQGKRGGHPVNAWGYPADPNQGKLF